LKCFGHILNLVVKAFLYGKADDLDGWELDADIWLNADIPAKEGSLEFWRKRGLFGRLRNIITYICWTPQRRGEFLQLSQDDGASDAVFLPISAGITQWNGDYRAIKRGLQIRTAIEFFTSRHKDDGLDDELSVDDWRELQDIAAILEPFHQITLELEGNRGNGSLYDIFPAFDILLEHLETCKGLYSGSTLHLL
jgi:hypothetical protein